MFLLVMLEQQCFVHTFLSVWEDQKCTTRLLHSFSNCTFLWHSFLPIFYDDAVSTKRNAVYYMRLFSKWGAPLLLLLPHWSISWVLLYEIEQKNPRLTYLEKANETYFRPLFKGLLMNFSVKIHIFHMSISSTMRWLEPLFTHPSSF